MASGSGNLNATSSPDIDPVTGLQSQPNHIWDTSARAALGTRAGEPRQIEVTEENHKLLKAQGKSAIAAVMAAKLAERRGGPSRGQRGTTPKIALTPTAGAVSAEGQRQEMRVVNVRDIPEHNRAYIDNKGYYYHPQTKARYRSGDVDPSGKPVQLSKSRYWKPVQE